MYKKENPIENNNETILIEINDMWAIGHYGFDKNLYTKMCVSRIKEIKINNISWCCIFCVQCVYMVWEKKRHTLVVCLFFNLFLSMDVFLDIFLI